MIESQVQEMKKLQTTDIDALIDKNKILLEILEKNEIYEEAKIVKSQLEQLEQRKKELQGGK